MVAIYFINNIGSVLLFVRYLIVGSFKFCRKAFTPIVSRVAYAKY